MPTDAFTKANPEEIGCRACGIFFLREKAEERERTRFRQSSEYEDLEIPAFIRDRMLTPEERMTEEIRKTAFSCVSKYGLMNEGMIPTVLNFITCAYLSESLSCCNLQSIHDIPYKEKIARTVVHFS